ncbi:MAG: hypothetical protein LBC19_02980, partial [Tannerella sp.]|nr:hypothetical protein [Tannerella sp.]
MREKAPAESRSVNIYRRDCSDSCRLDGQRHTVSNYKRPKGYPFLQSEFPSYDAPLDENGLIDYWVNSLPNGYQF